MDVKIEDSWKTVLQDEFSKPYFLQVVTHLKTERATKATIYPPGGLIFNAFDKTPFDKVKLLSNFLNSGVTDSSEKLGCAASETVFKR